MRGARALALAAALAPAAVAAAVAGSAGFCAVAGSGALAGVGVRAFGRAVLGAAAGGVAGGAPAGEGAAEAAEARRVAARANAVGVDRRRVTPVRLARGVILSQSQMKSVPGGEGARRSPARAALAPGGALQTAARAALGIKRWGDERPGASRSQAWAGDEGSREHESDAVHASAQGVVRAARCTTRSSAWSRR